MIPIDQLTEQKLQTRYESLSQGLKEALDSQTNVAIITETCKNHHLINEERVLMVQQLVGLVLLGFVHSYDIGKEINESLELGNPKLAASIADELGAKIFVPIKADIESNYEPVFEDAPQALYAASLQKPKPGERVVELDSLRINTPKPAPLGVIEPSRPFSPASAAPVPVRTVATPPPMPTISPRPAPIAPPVPAAQVPAAAKQPTVPLQKSGTPPPVMLHQESTAEPVNKMPGFSVSPADQLRGAKQEERPPARPAHLELGGVTPAVQPQRREETPIPSRALPSQLPRMKFDLSGIKPAGDALPRPPAPEAGPAQMPPVPQWPMPPIGESRTVPQTNPAPRFTPSSTPPPIKPVAPMSPPPKPPIPPIPPPFTPPRTSPTGGSPAPMPTSGAIPAKPGVAMPPPPTQQNPPMRKEEMVNLDSLRKIAKEPPQ